MALTAFLKVALLAIGSGQQSTMYNTENMLQSLYTFIALSCATGSPVLKLRSILLPMHVKTSLDCTEEIV
jgi:hypothetical protein